MSTNEGHIVAHGRSADSIGQGGTFQVIRFEVDQPLPPDGDPYIVTARWQTAPELSASSRLSIAAVPNDAGTHIGDAFIEAGIASPYYPATIFRLTRSTVNRDGRQRTFSSETKPKTTFVLKGNENTRGLGPMITDVAVDSLRKEYIGPPIQTNNYAFGCVNALAEGAQAELLPGKSVHIDTIARAAHVMHWLSDDPRLPVYGYPCNGDCSKNKGVFVDSPLVVGFRVDPDDVRIIPPTFLLRPNFFHGNCIRGFALLQNERQFSDVFVLTKPSQ